VSTSNPSSPIDANTDRKREDADEVMSDVGREESVVEGGEGSNSGNTTRENDEDGQGGVVNDGTTSGATSGTTNDTTNDTTNNGSSIVTPTAGAASTLPPAAANPPVVDPSAVVVRQIGSMSIDAQKCMHVIKGTWAQVGIPPAAPEIAEATTFTWKMSVAGDRDIAAFPSSGKYTGMYKIYFADATGKKKGKFVDVVETVDKLTFTQTAEGKYTCSGKGSNKYGHFVVSGAATLSPTGTGLECDIMKTYVAVDPNDLPEPCETHDVKVTTMCGKLQCVDENGHVRLFVKGKWSSDRLNLLVHESDLTQDQVISDFLLEHKSGTPYNKFVFPPDKNIKYSGWFKLLQTDGSVVEVKENDVSFKFIKNNNKGWNVDGRGRNSYGTFYLTGTLTDDYNLEIYKHFNARVSKVKNNTTKNAGGNPNLGNGNGNGNYNAHNSSSVHAATPAAMPAPLPVAPVFDEPTLSELKLEEGLEATSEPLLDGVPNYEVYMRGNFTYDSVSGVAKTEGSWCEKKAMFEDKHYTSKFELIYDPVDDADGSTDRSSFPFSSNQYKGSFSMKVGATSRKKVYEKKIALKFVLNKNNSYNVLGCGINEIGRFAVCGTYIPMGGNSGMLELYKWFTHQVNPSTMGVVRTKPNVVRRVKPATSSASNTLTNGGAKPWNSGSGGHSSVGGDTDRPVLKRQPSGRPIKVPNKNFDSGSTKLTPEMNAMIGILDKCKREDNWKWFAEPIDPVALGIPTYLTIIKQPMDFKTLYNRVVQGNVTTPLQFANEIRLIFTNCLLFNQPSKENELLLNVCKKIQKLFEVEYKNWQVVASQKQREAREQQRQQDDIVKANAIQQQMTESNQVRQRQGAAGVKRGRNAAEKELNAGSKRSRGGNNGDSNAGGGSSGGAEWAVMQEKMRQMEQMIARQANMLDMVQQQAMANEAKLEITAMGGGNTPYAMPTGPSFGNGGGVGVGMPTIAAAQSHSMPSFGSSGGGAMGGGMHGGGGGGGDNHDSSLDEVELTYKEMERITTAINKLEGDKLNQILKIIKQDTGVGDNEDELSFDELPIRTQRRLQNFLFKKGTAATSARAKKQPAKKQPAKKPATSMAPAIPAMSSFSSAPAPAPADVDTFAFDADLSGFGDEDGMGEDPYAAAAAAAAAGAASYGVADGGAAAADDDDDLWDGARAQASNNQAIMANQQRREEEIQSSLNQAGAQRMAEAQRIEAQQSAARANQDAAATLAEQERIKKEKTESEAQREMLRREREAVEASATFDAQALMMASLQNDAMESPLTGSLSPSGSDYGF
jgi:hypothetical protein